ncbi:MAG: DUF72 domain-containing protein, partial [Anaerolineales bacterium]
MGTKEELQKFFIGTSGWSYKHWNGLFYPSHIKPDRYLEYYMTRFSCVELNSCFYHLPKSATVKGWVSRTPDFFRFCPKLSRFITHQKRLKEAEAPLNRFFELFEEMKPRLGPVLIQLPPGLSFNKALVNDFFQILKRQYNAYRFAVEVRNKSWITDDFFNLLAQYDMAFVIADSGKRFPYFEEVTSDFIYLRFHGPENLYASDYSDHQLNAFAEKITAWMRNDKEIWAFFNNDFQGFAISNADKLRDM